MGWVWGCGCGCSLGVLFGNGILQQKACLAYPTWRGRVKHVEVKVLRRSQAANIGEIHTVALSGWVCRGKGRWSVGPGLDSLLTAYLPAVRKQQMRDEMCRKTIRYIIHTYWYTYTRVQYICRARKCCTLKKELDQEYIIIYLDCNT